jgi:hypothetical protein
MLLFNFSYFPSSMGSMRMANAPSSGSLISTIIRIIGERNMTRGNLSTRRPGNMANKSIDGLVKFDSHLGGDGLRAHEFAVIVHSVLVGSRCFHEAMNELLLSSIESRKRNLCSILSAPSENTKNSVLRIATEKDGSVEPSLRTVLPLSNSER